MKRMCAIWRTDKGAKYIRFWTEIPQNKEAILQEIIRMRPKQKLIAYKWLQDKVYIKQVTEHHAPFEISEATYRRLNRLNYKLLLNRAI